MSDEEEIWKTYPEFHFIEASNLGRVRTKNRFVTDRNGKKYHIKGHVLKQQLNKNGYMYVSVSVNGKNCTLSVHRIVATCFIPNPDNLPEVNHIDNDRTNNVASNLEWCTSKYNTAYKEKCGKSAAEISGRPVIVVNQDTSEVFWFETQREAGRQLSFYPGHITDVVRDRRHTTGGYWFCYADENAVEKVRSKFGNKIAEKVGKLISENKKV